MTGVHFLPVLEAWKSESVIGGAVLPLEPVGAGKLCLFQASGGPRCLSLRHCNLCPHRAYSLPGLLQGHQSYQIKDVPDSSMASS